LRRFGTLFRHLRTAIFKLVYSSSSASPELHSGSDLYTWAAGTVSCCWNTSILSSLDLDLESPQEPVEISKGKRPPVNPVSGRQGQFSLFPGYLSPSHNCSWAFLCPLGTVLGIQFGRFPPVWIVLVLRYCKFGSGEDSAEFSRSSKMQALPSVPEPHSGVYGCYRGVSAVGGTDPR
jgi:hypothetical protein